MLHQDTAFRLIAFLEEYDHSIKRDDEKEIFIADLKERAEAFELTTEDIGELESWVGEINDDGPQEEEIYDLVGELG